MSFCFFSAVPFHPILGATQVSFGFYNVVEFHPILGAGFAIVRNSFFILVQTINLLSSSFNKEVTTSFRSQITIHHILFTINYLYHSRPHCIVSAVGALKVDYISSECKKQQSNFITSLTRKPCSNIITLGLGKSAKHVLIHFTHSAGAGHRETIESGCRQIQLIQEKIMTRGISSKQRQHGNKDNKLDLNTGS